MNTHFVIIRPDGTEETGEVDLPAEPSYHQLSAVMTPILGEGNYMERVNVLVKGAYTDMFVDEDGQLKGLPVNVKATAIYRHNWLTHHPNTPADNLPTIVGVAVLFGRKVWY